jgi:hypothetical protein
VQTKWFRDLDSNQDTQLQRLMSYRLDDPGIAMKSLAERFRFTQVGSEDVGNQHEAGKCAGRKFLLN